MRGSSRSYEASFSGLQDHKSKLLGFKEFFTVSTLSSSSEVYQLLLDEDDNLSVVLHWGLGKLTKEEMPERLLLRSHSQDLDQEQAWLVKCYRVVYSKCIAQLHYMTYMYSACKRVQFQSAGGYKQVPMSTCKYQILITLYNYYTHFKAYNVGLPVVFYLARTISTRQTSI